jgi:hypothetical protein
VKVYGLPFVMKPSHVLISRLDTVDELNLKLRTIIATNLKIREPDLTRSRLWKFNEGTTLQDLRVHFERAMHIFKEKE